MRTLVVALTFALGSAGTLPLWATLLGVADVHVCRCSRDHHDCVCARCHTDPDATTLVSSETLSNRCGDDEVVYGGKRLVTLPAPSCDVSVAVVSKRAPAPPRDAPTRSLIELEPPTPPPRPFA